MLPIDLLRLAMPGCYLPLRSSAQALPRGHLASQGSEIVKEDAPREDGLRVIGQFPFSPFKNIR